MTADPAPRAPIRKVLVANRGEIALRVVRACAAYGVASVAVYADADADALHVRRADEAWALPGRTAAETYLSVEALVGVARRSGADAVHPGYGFLSESAAFARAVAEAGLRWVGPPPEAIERLGDKTAAREVARSVGAPLAPGSNGPVDDVDAVLAFADAHGLPLVVKAAFGGGGRGMRVVRRREEVAELFAAAQREAVAAFGRGECFVETFLERPRHVEVQVLADAHGRVAALGTRDCSLQRRHQKLVEEAPAPFLTDAQRSELTESACRIVGAVGYEGAATVEFLLSADGTCAFLEVNTRLQVEHPVTEETTGVDIVRQQLRIAEGLPLELPETLDASGTPEPRGHSIEFRINAEDPGRGFVPTPGVIERFDLPGGPGVRVDAGVVAGSVVSREFDAMVAKLVVTGRDRSEALRRARVALAEFSVTGVATVLPFHRRVLDDPAFAADTAEGFTVHTRWIEEECTWLDELATDVVEAPGEPVVHRTWVEVDGRRLALGLPHGLLAAPSASSPAPPQTPPDDGADDAGGAEVRSPGAGSVVRWLVDDGAAVDAGQDVVVVEAMKMESPLAAPRSGTLEHLVAAGAEVSPRTVVGRVS